MAVMTVGKGLMPRLFERPFSMQVPLSISPSRQKYGITRKAIFAALSSDKCG